ncbi:hypothetical protein [Paenibacillus radicis (ex Gao et al. 2016)]|uniref:DUF3052 domain-containing protein n=1 Tax=Paenibacillus radicis (ex Gao et al. 2016) TaxID=1737354 RepID=A0A917GZN2_9BACL|nr:hypothetical protein [Paenibacillus radicis (ex Gao et al. 2016)]GGG61954.1 hypothetical protein GCM10010918_14440 [Paenibacillus radicis (ex Gao et al. 2016)]
MNEALLKKMHYKQGSAIVLHAPEGYVLGVESDDGQAGPYAFIQLFVSSLSDAAEKIPQTLPLVAEDAVFWITYPKKGPKIKPDINRDSLAALVQETTAYRPVSNVAVDEQWSALRFRLKEKVKSVK